MKTCKNRKSILAFAFKVELSIAILSIIYSVKRYIILSIITLFRKNQLKFVISKNKGGGTLYYNKLTHKRKIRSIIKILFAIFKVLLIKYKNKKCI